MADQTQTQLSGIFLPEYQEKYLKDLLANVTDISKTSPLGDVAAPDVMQFTPNQLEAIRLGRAGIGAYEPMMREAEASFDTAGTAYGSGVSALGGTMGGFDLSGYAGDVTEGQEGLRGTTRTFADSADQYMNPYEDAVVQQALADIQKAGQERATQIGGAAAGAGAFGGSRFAVENALLNRDILEQSARTAGQLRRSGYESGRQAFENQLAREGRAATGIVNMGSDLANKGMSAFENQMNRGQQASQIFGQLGQGIASLGAREAALGNLAQTSAQSDVNALYNIGSLEQQQQQREFDVQRQGQMEQAYEPFRRFSYMSDIFRGVPSTSSTLSQTTVPSPSPLNAVMGNAMGLGAYQNFSGY